MKKLGTALVCGAVVIGLCANAALALPPFKKAFQERYVDKSDNAEFKEAFEKAGCNTCHLKSNEPGKKPRNAYGKALEEQIPGDAKKRMAEAKEKGEDEAKAEMKKLLGELDKAFDKVETEKSPSGETYGERIKAGKLPVDAPK